VRRLLFASLLSALALAGCIVIEREVGPSPSGGSFHGGERPPPAEPAPLEARSDRLQLGSLGWALLSPDVPNAVLEIDQIGGARLAGEAVAAMEEALREHGGKQRVDVVTSSVDGGGDVWSLEDLLGASQQHRDRSSGGDTVAVHVLVLPGRFQAEGVPGAAFHATAMAIFPGEVERMLPRFAAVDAFQVSVAVHELGHLFGLVNLTGAGEFHEDPDHPGHTDQEDSVMYWAIESPSMGELFRTGPPREFNADDREEMARIRDQRP
jgi:hypothetical protein